MKINGYVPSLLTAAIIGLAGTSLPAIAETAPKASTAGSTQAVDQQQSSAINDAWLQGKLESTLLFNEHLNSFNIDTEVTNRVAILAGTVESDIDRDLAGEIAESIDGVESVQNKLKVAKATASTEADTEEAQERQSFKQRVIDATLTARVKTQLMLNGNTSGLAIDVDSSAGTVSLTGEVESAQEKELAARIAANTSGTESVKNELQVTSGNTEEEEAE